MGTCKREHLEILRELVIYFIKCELNTPFHAYNTLRIVASADRNKFINDTDALEIHLNREECRNKKSINPIEKFTDNGLVKYRVSPEGEYFLEGVVRIITSSEYLSINSVLSFFEELTKSPLNLLFDILALSIFIDDRDSPWKNITPSFDKYIVLRLKFSAKAPLWYNHLLTYSGENERKVSEVVLTTKGIELTEQIVSKLIISK